MTAVATSGIIRVPLVDAEERPLSFVRAVLPAGHPRYLVLLAGTPVVDDRLCGAATRASRTARMCWVIQPVQASLRRFPGRAR